ncbi:hypothetical protein ACOSP7_016156 [Xanthoceras sorbifolium]
MALIVQKNLFRTFVQSMHDEGLINNDFNQVLAMRETVKRDYVVRTVTSYCMSTEALFTHMTCLISQPMVDYLQIDAGARELFTRATGVGAERVKLACTELVQACEQNNMENCYRALYWAKTEYSKLRRKFETLVQMERKIIDLESGF